jgi:hypothetical protein
MPDLWDTNPDHVFGAPDPPPDPEPPPGGDRARQVALRDREGRLRLPAYILITLAIALAATLLVTVAMRLASG